jgi:hypothetical protein
MVLTNTSTWRVTIPLHRMIFKIEILWPGIITAIINAIVEKLKPAWGERIIDWCLIHSMQMETIKIILLV